MNIFYSLLLCSPHYLLNSITSRERTDLLILTTLWYCNLQIFNIFTCPQIAILLFPVFSVLKIILPLTSLYIYGIIAIGKQHLKSLVILMNTI